MEGDVPTSTRRGGLVAGYLAEHPEPVHAHDAELEHAAVHELVFAPRVYLQALALRQTAHVGAHRLAREDLYRSVQSELAVVYVYVLVVVVPLDDPAVLVHVAVVPHVAGLDLVAGAAAVHGGRPVDQAERLGAALPLLLQPPHRVAASVPRVALPLAVPTLELGGRQRPGVAGADVREGEVLEEDKEAAGEEDAVRVGLDRPVVLLVHPQADHLGPDVVEDLRVECRVPLAAEGDGQGDVEEGDGDRQGATALVELRGGVAEHGVPVAREDADALLLLHPEQVGLVAERHRERVAEQRWRCRVPRPQPGPAGLLPRTRGALLLRRLPLQPLLDPDRHLHLLLLGPGRVLLGRPQGLLAAFLLLHRRLHQLLRRRAAPLAWRGRLRPDPHRVLGLARLPARPRR
mmetsp:Transcript_83139/g.235851  ORF Transcript_83139/g.235851 Transcript_83139/m.235851 type:complete len:404 (-) Transcript_83139:868-2079(-)